MTKVRVLVTAELDKNMLNQLSSVFDLKYAGYGNNYRMLSHEELKTLCKETDILVSEFDMIDEDILSGSSIKLIVCCRAGVSTVVDLEAAKKYGIIVCNNIGRNKEATADFTIGLIYDLTRHISLTNHLAHTNIDLLRRPMPPDYGDSLWGLDSMSPYVLYRGRSMSKLTIGIIGYGSIGKTVVSKLKKNGFNYLIHTHNPPQNDPKFVDLDTLLKNSDVVSLHISGNKNKEPIFGIDEFNKMKKTAYFINTSRGYLVNESELYYSLKNGIIAGAAMDVSTIEPMKKDNKLLELGNIIITPHIAGSSEDTIVTGTQMAIDAILGYAKNDIPNRVV